MKKLMLAFSVVSFMILFVSCSGTGNSNSPSAAAEAYYKAMKSGDFEKALSYSLIADDNDKQMVISALEEMRKGGFEIKDFKIISEEILEDGENAHVKVEVTTVPKQGQEPETDTDNLSAMKVNGVWMVGVN